MPTVLDPSDIAKRRRELFGGATEQPWNGMDREATGTSKDHCGICPMKPDEPCSRSCSVARSEIKDGVKVS